MIGEAQFAGDMCESGASDEGERLIAGGLAVGIDCRQIDPVGRVRDDRREVGDLIGSSGQTVLHSFEYKTVRAGSAGQDVGAEPCL